MSKEPLRKTFPRVREVIKNGTPRYVCDSRSKIFAAGKQEWFSTKQDALNRAKEIEEAITKGNTLTNDERTLFIRYRDALALHGKKIEEVLETALKRASNKAIKDEDEKKTVSELVDLWIESKKKQQFTSIRPVTLKEIEYTGKKIKGLWGGNQYDSVKKEHVIEFLAAHKGAYTTKKNWKVRIGGFFNWCNSEGWGRGNPAKNIEIEKTTPNAPEIISTEKVKRMLELVQNSPRYRPLANYLALGFFGGLRPFELTRLTWRYIDLKEKPVTTKWGESWGAIEIRTEMTKTRPRASFQLTQRLQHSCTSLRTSQSTLRKTSHGASLHCERKPDMGSRVIGQKRTVGSRIASGILSHQCGCLFTTAVTS